MGEGVKKEEKQRKTIKRDKIQRNQKGAQTWLGTE